MNALRGGRGVGVEYADVEGPKGLPVPSAGPLLGILAKYLFNLSVRWNDEKNLLYTIDLKDRRS